MASPGAIGTPRPCASALILHGDADVNTRLDSAIRDDGREKGAITDGDPAPYQSGTWSWPLIDFADVILSGEAEGDTSGFRRARFAKEPRSRTRQVVENTSSETV